MLVPGTKPGMPGWLPVTRGSCYFKWGSVHRRLKCMPSLGYYPGRRARGPLWSCRNYNALPWVSQPWVNSMVRLARALDM